MSSSSLIEKEKEKKEKEKKKEERDKEFKIGNYQIKRTLGQGTFGKVKLGIYLPTREKVAIKILEKSKIKEKDDEIRINREFEMLTKFNHINVILVTEIFESYDSYYTVMEYCEGGELFNYIVKKKRLSEEEASFFYYQIINGLEYIHSLNMVHRDLKPENLLLTKDHILKIIDFGLSNYFYDKNKLLSTPCGSPCYASPEMVSGKKYNGFKIDVWSSGIVLYAMLCGFLPFEDKDNEILFKKIRKCKLEFPHHISLISKDLIKKILVTNPDKRISIKEIKRHPFFLKGKTIFNQTFSFKKLPKELSLDKDIEYRNVKTESDDKENNKDNNNKKEKEVSKNINNDNNNLKKDNEKDKENDKDKEEENKNFNTVENKHQNRDNIKITYEDDILDLEKKKQNDDINNKNNNINDYAEKVSKTEPNTYNNKRPISNNPKTFSPNQQFSTISHLSNHFNKINNYSNNINSMRIPFNKILNNKHKNEIIKIKLLNNGNDRNNINSNKNYKIEYNNNQNKKYLNTNHLILNIIKMFNKSERKKPEVKIYDSLLNNYKENTVKTQENNIKSNRRPSSIYKKELLLRNNKKKHNKINSMKLSDVYSNNSKTNRRNLMSFNTINNSTLNSNNSRHSKLSSYQTTSTSIGKNKGHLKSKTKQSLDNKIIKFSFGDFIKKMK